MTTILIPREPIPVALTAEQVVAYLLRPGSGWVEVEGSASYREFERGNRGVGVPLGSCMYPVIALRECILDIARAESRPAEQVAADIAGPAVGVVGVGCADKLTGAAWAAQTKCMIRGWPAEKRRSAMVNFVAFAAELDEDKAPRAPEVE